MLIEYANEHENRLSYGLVTREKKVAKDGFSASVLR